MNDDISSSDITKFGYGGGHLHSIKSMPVKVSHFTAYIANEMVVLLVTYLKSGMAFHRFYPLNEPKMLKGGQGPINGIKR